jgi:group II intron reverse transcriptase/maturase
MQSAETVLDVIRRRGERGQPVKRLYRQLFNPQLYLMAYGRIHSNQGAMTPGVTGETVDGMSLAKIEAIIDDLRHERHRWSPVKRVYILKKNGKKRPLGMPTWTDKLIAEVVRLLLEAYYDVQFSDHSHGFRPGRGCHTALSEVANVWKGTHWFIEGDISDCFGSLDHVVMKSILAENIHDGRFLRLINNMLKAGYLEDWRWNVTLSGAPQGGVASPILSNIYLDRLDQFVEQQLIPDYTQGRLRRPNPKYRRVKYQIRKARLRGDRYTAHDLRKRMHALSSHDPNDPGYRRLRYVRYADDWLLGFAGPKREAEAIKARIQTFLRDDLKLALSESKTLITHASTASARFLGYDIKVQHADDKIDRRQGRRTVNGNIGLFLPESFIKERSARYMKMGRPELRGQLVHDHDYTIVSKYQSEYRGYVNYYLLAQDVHRLGRLRWAMEISMLKTLAAKHKSTVSKIARKFKTTIQTPNGPRTCFRVVVNRDGNRKPLVAQFGGVPLQRQRMAILTDHLPAIPSPGRNELIHRLLAGCCEICEGRENLAVHHIRKLADLDRYGRKEKPAWIKLMAKRRRKTIVVCRKCHTDIHAGRLTVAIRK